MRKIMVPFFSLIILLFLASCSENPQPPENKKSPSVNFGAYESIEPEPTERIIYRDSKPKIVYKEKIIHKIKRIFVRGKTRIIYRKSKPRIIYRKSKPRIIYRKPKRKKYKKRRTSTKRKIYKKRRVSKKRRKRKYKTKNIRITKRQSLKLFIEKYSSGSGLRYANN